MGKDTVPQSIIIEDVPLAPVRLLLVLGRLGAEESCGSPGLEIRPANR